jgi:hypothetical protein
LVLHMVHLLYLNCLLANSFLRLNRLFFCWGTYRHLYSKGQ